MVDIEEKIDELETPEGVEINYIEFTQEVECVITVGDDETLTFVDDIDPIHDQLFQSGGLWK